MGIPLVPHSCTRRAGASPTHRSGSAFFTLGVSAPPSHSRRSQTRLPRLSILQVRDARARSRGHPSHLCCTWLGTNDTPQGPGHSARSRNGYGDRTSKGIPRTGSEEISSPLFGAGLHGTQTCKGTPQPLFGSPLHDDVLHSLSCSNSCRVVWQVVTNSCCTSAAFHWTGGTIPGTTSDIKRYLSARTRGWQP